MTRITVTGKLFSFLFEAGAIVNNLYGSASDLDASPSTSGVRTDVYSSINRPEQIVDKQNVTYNIDGEGKRSKWSGVFLVFSCLVKYSLIILKNQIMSCTKLLLSLPIYLPCKYENTSA